MSDDLTQDYHVSQGRGPGAVDIPISGTVSGGTVSRAAPTLEDRLSTIEAAMPALNALAGDVGGTSFEDRLQSIETFFAHAAPVIEELAPVVSALAGNGTSLASLLSVAAKQLMGHIL